MDIADQYKKKELVYRPDIDVLRALAVLSVVSFHAFPNSVSGGFVGVDVFFVISGYLITSIILSDLYFGKFSFLRFYERRVRRIFPALFLVLVFVVFGGFFILFSDEYRHVMKHVFAGSSFLSNFFLFSESGYFDVMSERKPLLHLWSLSIEEQFYILWPLFLYFLFKRKRMLVISMFFVVFISFLSNVLLLNYNSVAAFYFPFTRFWELLVGSVLAYAHVNTLSPQKAFVGFLNKKRCSKRVVEFFSGERTSVVLVSIGLGMILISVLTFTQDYKFPGYWACIPTFGAAMVIAGGRPALLKLLLENKVLVGIGLISYPLYLWHWPILSFLRIYYDHELSSLICIIGVILSFILATLTYMLLEQPIRFGRLKDKSSLVYVGLMFFMACVGVTGYVFDGFPDRYGFGAAFKNSKELKKPSATDDHGILYFTGGLEDKPVFPYAKFCDAKSKETLAIIGDSHAHVSFQGIASEMQARGINTALLANSGCPPLLGGEYGATLNDKNICKQRIEAILKAVVDKNDIDKVVMFMRGEIYMSKKGFSECEKNIVYNDSYIPRGVYFKSLQKTVDYLNAYNKKVYLVSENPELYYQPRACISRPFRAPSRDCSVKLDDVLDRQREYLDGLASISGATIINSLDFFCPDGDCLVFDDGKLLYYDANHLSVSGSFFQARNIVNELMR